MVAAPPRPDVATMPVAPTVGPARRRRTRPTDVLLPMALGLWLFALHGTNADAMDDWGLLHVLPVTFFVGLGVLLVSIGFLLTDDRPSPWRCALHVVALVAVLHGTVPLLFPQANYPWAYKHMGVVGYINVHGRLDSTVDIYQNWPGFFTAAALFDRIAGVGSPLAYAKWAPVYFNLLLCLQLAFVVRGLPLGRRERWLAIFLFVAGNWVGQDYFAPQALALVLCLAVYGMVLAFLHVDRRPAVVRFGGRLAGRFARASVRQIEGPVVPATATRSRRERIAALGLLFTVFAVVVVTHQLSPYLVVAGIALLTLSGLVRPRWVVIGLAAVMVAYLVPHLPYLRNSRNLSGSPLNPRDILNSLSNPFENLQSSGFDGGTPRPGRVLTSLGAPALIAGMGLLAVIGAWRRLRGGRPMLLLLVLAAAPAMLAFGQNYGGEAIFRVYLFSLPWLAALAASVPRTGRWGLFTGAATVVVLSGVAALFMAAFWGSVELYRVRPGAVAASQYFYDHAPRGSVLGLGAPNIPARLGANYDEFLGGSTPPALTTLAAFQGHVLGAADLPALSRLYQEHMAATAGRVYLALGADQDVYAEVLGFMPKGSLAHLDGELARSAEWRVVLRNRDAVMYEFIGPGSPPQQPLQQCGRGGCGTGGSGDSGQGIVDRAPGELGATPGGGDVPPGP